MNATTPEQRLQQLGLVLPAVVAPRGNFDAYVLHTRHGSLVTVGSFESEQDDKLRNMQQQLGTLRVNGGVSLDLLPQPVAIRVPKL